LRNGPKISKKATVAARSRKAPAGGKPLARHNGQGALIFKVFSHLAAARGPKTDQKQI